MKRVLSIDLDYIAKPNIEEYNPSDLDTFYHQNPFVRWNTFFEFTDVTANNINIDVSNLIFCYQVFLKALSSNSNSVSFGYEHDAILYAIDKFENIDLVHIDHHDDFLSGEFVEEDVEILNQTGKFKVTEYEQIIKSGNITEGNWIAWLHSQNKLSNYVWICNENSGNKARNKLISKFVDGYYCITKDEVDFTSYYFDHIFVCLSPQYISPQHWHYFTMFMLSYEEFTGKSSKDCWIKDRKYMNENYYNKLTETLDWSGR